MAGPAKRARAEPAVALPPASPPGDAGSGTPEDSAAGGPNGATAAAAAVPVDWTTLPYDVAVLVAERVRDIYARKKPPRSDADTPVQYKRRSEALWMPERKGREALFALSRARMGPLSDAACTLLFRPIRAPGGGDGGGGGGGGGSGRGGSWPSTLFNKYRQETMYTARHSLSMHSLATIKETSAVPYRGVQWCARWNAATGKFDYVKIADRCQKFWGGFWWDHPICPCTATPCSLLRTYCPIYTPENVPGYATTDILLVMRSIDPATTWLLKHLYPITRASDGTLHFALVKCNRDGPAYANTYVGVHGEDFCADGRTAMVFSGAAERMFAAIQKEQRAYRAARRAQERSQPARKRERYE